MSVVVKRSAFVVLSLVVLVLISGPALAGGKASERSDSPAASSKCPQSISARYPWIACRTTPMGTQVIAGPTGNDSWETHRATPSHDPFVNRGGYFGPAENR